MTLQQFFEEHPRVAIAFSGGVDSAYLLYAAKENDADVRAYYVKSPFQPQFEYEDALQLARQLDVSMTVLELDILSDPTIAANPRNRFLSRRHNASANALNYRGSSVTAAENTNNNCRNYRSYY